MPLERRYSIGVSDDGTRFMTHLYSGHDLGGLREEQLAKLKDFLGNAEVLGERVESLEFETYLGDRTTVSGPDLGAIVMTRDTMISMFHLEKRDFI